MKKKNITTFREAEDYINDIPRFTSKHSMEETRAFLHSLGDPDRELRIIHVAGTNGKGSVCACMSSILEAAGYRTALFTSPHLVSIRERFVADGKKITEEAFLQVFLHIYNMLDWDVLEREEKGAYHPTYFEYLFFMAMVLFAEKRPDFCILETGVGGRLDATNSVNRKEISVITHIGLDHVEYLGNTVAEIAGEKAGILKEGVPVVYDASDPEAEAVIRKRAHELHAPAFGVRPEMYKISSMTDKHIDFSIHSGYYDYIELSISSVAEYQVMNAAEAVTAIKALDGGAEFTADTIRRGIDAMRWQGRMETVLPGVIIDGAHNEAGVEEFVKTAKRLEKDYPVTLLFAAVDDKDYPSMIQTICRELRPERVIVTEVGGYRAVEAEKSAALFRQSGMDKITAYADAEEAFAAALREKADGILFCVGSLYLAGSIKGILRRMSHD